MDKTILVVEDEITLQDVIKKKLTLSGFNVLTARATDEAVDVLKNNPNINCIWLDHYLFGDKNGLDFVIAMKDKTEWKDIPIYVVSNTASPEKVKSYLKLGVNKYYTKANNKLEEIIKDIKTNLNKGE